MKETITGRFVEQTIIWHIPVGKSGKVVRVEIKK